MARVYGINSERGNWQNVYGTGKLKVHARIVTAVGVRQ